MAEEGDDKRAFGHVHNLLNCRYLVSFQGPMPISSGTSSELLIGRPRRGVSVADLRAAPGLPSSSRVDR
jgi:hypothetical protein